MIEVGEEVTREDATEEMQIAVGAEEVETSEKDFEVDMTTSTEVFHKTKTFGFFSYLVPSILM